jgi:hypothetical protein
MRWRSSEQQREMLQGSPFGSCPILPFAVTGWSVDNSVGAFETPFRPWYKMNCIESSDSISSPTNNRLTLAREHRGRGGHVTHLRVALAVDHNPSVAKGRHYVCADVLCFRDTHAYMLVGCIHIHIQIYMRTLIVSSEYQSFLYFPDHFTAHKIKNPKKISEGSPFFIYFRCKVFYMGSIYIEGGKNFYCCFQ